MYTCDRTHRLSFTGRRKVFKTMNLKGIDFQMSFESEIVKDSRKDGKSRDV